MNKVVNENFGHVFKQLRLRCWDSKDFLEGILRLRRKLVLFFPSRYDDISDPLLHVQHSWYLFVVSIPGCSEAFGGVQLDGGATDHLDAALSVFYTQRSHTTVYLKKE